MATAQLIEAVTPRRRYERRLAAIQRDLDRLSAATVRDTLALLSEMRARAVADLTLLGEAGGWPAYRLNALLTSISAVSSELERRMVGIVQQGSAGAWDVGAASAPTALGLDMRPLIDRDQLVVAQQLQADLVRRVSADFRTRAAREVTIAVAGGQSPYEATQKIGDLLRTQPARQTRMLGLIAGQAERLVRTEMMTAFNLADRARDDDIGALVPELRKWWDATGDGRTRPSHAAAESRYHPGGSIGPIPLAADFRVGGEAASGPHDPRLSAAQRVNCRCVRALWSPEWV